MRLDKKEIVRDLSTYELNSTHLIKFRDKMNTLNIQLKKVKQKLKMKYIFDKDANVWKWEERDGDDDFAQEHHERAYLPCN